MSDEWHVGVVLHGFRLIDSAFITYVAGVEGARGFEEEDVHFVVGNGAVLKAARDDEHVAGFQINISIAKFHAEATLDDEEELVFVLVMVPYEWPRKLGEFDVLAVQFADDARGPMVAEQRELFGEVQFPGMG